MKIFEEKIDGILLGVHCIGCSDSAEMKGAELAGQRANKLESEFHDTTHIVIPCWPHNKRFDQAMGWQSRKN